MGRAKLRTFFRKCARSLRPPRRLELLESTGHMLNFKVLTGAPRYGHNEAIVKRGSQELTTCLYISRIEGEFCWGTWVDNTAEEMAMAEQVRLERRSRERATRRLRVGSPSLPGFSSLTEDIGSDGLRLLVRCPVTPGTKLELSLEPDQFGLVPIKLRGEVMWCRPSADGHQAGISLKGSPRHRLQAVEKIAFHHPFTRASHTN